MPPSPNDTFKVEFGRVFLRIQFDTLGLQCVDGLAEGREVNIQRLLQGYGFDPGGVCVSMGSCVGNEIHILVKIFLELVCVVGCVEWQNYGV